MSSRAAWRLDSLGFANVFYYKPGKADWLASGLPVEKEGSAAMTLLEAMTREVPSCGLNDSVSEAKARAEKLGWDICAVVNEQGIVLGLLEKDAWSKAADPVERILQPAPTTFRPNFPVDDAVEFLDKHDLDAVLITTPEGKLMGIFRRAGAPRQQQIPKSEIWA